MDPQRKLPVMPLVLATAASAAAILAIRSQVLGEILLAGALACLLALLTLHGAFPGRLRAGLLDRRGGDVPPAGAGEGIGRWEWRGGDRFLSWSPELWALHGLEPRSEAPGLMEALQLVHPEDRARVEAGFIRSRRDGDVSVRDYRVVRPDESIIHLQALSEVVPGHRGRPARLRGTVRDRTQAHLDEAALRLSERRFRALTQKSPVAVYESDADGRIVLVNETYTAITGQTFEMASGYGWRRGIHPDDVEMLGELWIAASKGGYVSDVEYRYVRPDGSTAWCVGSATALNDEEGNVSGFIGTCVDITERRVAEDALRQAEGRFRTAFEEAPIGMCLTGLDGCFLKVNRSLCEITGYPREQLEGMDLRSITHVDDLAQSEGALRRASAEGGYRGEKRYIHADGHEVSVDICSTLVSDAEGEPLHFLAQVQDITERKRFHEDLRYQADHDPLTGMFNRRRFEKELESELDAATRVGGPIGLMVIDLDHFKYINDSLGHSVGDEVIARVGRALSTGLPERHVLARLGGDEFAAILPGVPAGQVRLAADGLLDAVRHIDLAALAPNVGTVSASIGVAVLATAEGMSAEEMLVDADIAMFDAKEAGRGRVVVHDGAEQRHERMRSRMTWAERVREALAEDRFVLHGQPIASLTGDTTPRTELLIRMIGADGELIPPGSFLQTAERFDLIQDIDRWVVGQAAGILAERRGEGEQSVLCVNLSGKSITDPEMPQVIATALADHGIDGRGLCFEITETAAIVNVDRAKAFASMVRGFGCEVALDDFGAGFASFYYLKHFDFDLLKIDGEFVKDLLTSSTNRLVVKALVDIARGLGKRTVAEFVEDEGTLGLLREMQVDFAQGFHIARPGPLEALPAIAAAAPLLP
jgi:diguanylate cyclase (GGDEF)-like protein/PAS domain S-box-containing protein